MDKDQAQRKKVYETVDDDWSKDESNMKEMQVVEMLKELINLQ